MDYVDTYAEAFYDELENTIKKTPRKAILIMQELKETGMPKSAQTHTTNGQVQCDDLGQEKQTTVAP